ncbi:MAG: sugar transferase [Anaerolineae bacterium]|jgi:lipopolysaccharide/colanic/teichoic acid biosynthesis glycosyltransferase|nr:sugar transferase [Anaerolineae bacterium]
MVELSDKPELTPTSHPNVEGSSVLKRTQARRRSRTDEVLKALMDYGFTAIGLVLLAPLLIALAVIVKLDSPGPVLHRRRVMGKGGTQFDAFKFRTMYVNGEEILASYPELKAQLERDHKLPNDPRVTRCGRWMRKFSLDELPQLFNVMLGQMSLVGPRMISPKELSRYGEHADELLTVKPGITGLWQISGRSNLAPGERVRLDMQFIRTRSAWGDFKLLLLTIPAVLRGQGAY